MNTRAMSDELTPEQREVLESEPERWIETPHGYWMGRESSQSGAGITLSLDPKNARRLADAIITERTRWAHPLNSLMGRLLDMTTRELIIGTLALLLWLAFLLMLFYLV